MSQSNTWAEANRRAAKEIGGHAAVARLLGLRDRRNVFPWTSGKRMFPETYCALIEQAAQTVTRRELRPNDWRQCWPELVQQKESVHG